MYQAHFAGHVIRPTLNLLQMGGPSAEALLLGTALAESGLRYLVQIGGGPALGVYQIEPDTAQWLRHDYLLRQAKRGVLATVRTLETGRPLAEQLVTNLALQTALARLRYWVRPEPLPGALDARGLRDYHERFYNANPANLAPVEHFEDAIRVVRELD